MEKSEPMSDFFIQMKKYLHISGQSAIQELVSVKAI